MADLTGRTQIFAGDTSDVDTVVRHPQGTRAFDVEGNEYIYLAGCANTDAGDWVSFDEDHATILLTAQAVGRVGIAMADIDATTDYGWYQIYGKNTIAITDTVAADAPLYINGTSGRVDDASDTGQWICGAWSRSADTANVVTVELNYPCVHNSGYLV